VNKMRLKKMFTILIFGGVMVSVLFSGCVEQKSTSTNESQLEKKDITSVPAELTGTNMKPSTLAVKEEIRLTDGLGRNEYPAWSKDGKKVAYSSDRSGNLDIWVMDDDGNNKRQLTTNPGTDERPAWSPDGKKIVFVSDRIGSINLWIMDSDGTNQKQLTVDDAKKGGQGWSPDGKRLIYSLDRSGNFDIWMMDTNGENRKQLTTEDGADYVYPQSFSPDGKNIVFTSYRSGNGDVWKMNLQDSSLDRLTEDNSWEGTPAWSPDGNWIAFSSDAYGNRDIWIMDYKGKNKKRLTNNTDVESFPTWSPDSKRIAYVKGNDIWAVILTEVPFKAEETTSSESIKKVKDTAEPDIHFRAPENNIVTSYVYVSGLLVGAYVDVIIENRGATGTFDVVLKVNNIEQDRKSVILGEQKLSFLASFSDSDSQRGVIITISVPNTNKSYDITVPPNYNKMNKVYNPVPTQHPTVPPTPYRTPFKVTTPPPTPLKPPTPMRTPFKLP